MDAKGCTRTIVGLAILGALCLPTTLGDDGAGTETKGIAEQLAGIRGELESIVQLLGSVEEQQQLSVLMTRIRLKQQRLLSIEGQLRSSRDEQESVEREVKRLEAIEQTWDDSLDDKLNADEVDEGQRRELELLRQEKQSLESRAELLRLRIVELENDVSRAQDDIRALEETVDERLGLR